jgi:hypothetical protein
LVITHRRNNLLPDDKVYVVWEHGLMESGVFDAMQAKHGQQQGIA